MPEPLSCRIMNAIHLALVTATLLHVTGCKKGAASDGDESRVAAAPQVQAVHALAATMQATPALTADTLVLEPGAPVVFEAPDSYNASTAGLLHADDLPGLSGPHTQAKYGIPEQGLFGTCDAVLKGGGFVSEHKRPVVLKNCAQARYVSVVRTLQAVEPTPHADGLTYTAGRVSGEAHVFAIGGAKYLGGFPFEARNSDSVKLTGIVKDAKTHLDRDLAARLGATVSSKLREHAR
jgi:hypothetical protein